MRVDTVGFASVICCGIFMAPLLVEPDPPSLRTPEPTRVLASVDGADQTCGEARLVQTAKGAASVSSQPEPGCAPHGVKVAEAR